MTGAAFLFLALTVVVAAGDWVAVWHQNRALEHLCKPLTILALIGVALALEVDDPTVRSWFIVALIFSLAGDVFLMLERDLFVIGLASFLVAHLAYIGGFVVEGQHGIGVLVGALFVALLIVLVGTQIVRAAQESEPELGVPVMAYMAVISAMVVVAVGAGQPLGVLGAGLFYASDAMIGWHRFVHPSRLLPLAIIVTYHLAQTALVLSLI
jgi:uncharacterized membrane protein YhhN